ncbi:MAG: serine/threonine protein kinase, partial [Gammaproteobacteria bacterium]
NEQQLRALIVHVLRGLYAVHSRSFLHRDIKPSNILIRQSGPPVLLDFGAARQSLEQRAGTLTVVLTPGYAPLEQYGGDQEQGPWSDLYALGATAYHCLLGEKPSGSMERVAAVHAGQEDPVAVNMRRIRRAVDERIARAIEFMLMLHAADRPSSAHDVLVGIMGEHAPTLQREAAAPLSAAVAETMHATPNRDPRATGGGLRSSVSVPSSGYTRPAPSPSLHAPSDTPSSQTVGEDLVAAAEAKLAEFVGPIARVLVKRAAQTYGSRREFCAALADEIDDPNERNEFLRSIH